jgi:hypothetical protein
MSDDSELEAVKLELQQLSAATGNADNYETTS